MSVNVVTVTGNLGADGELRYTQKGTAILTFNVAVNERVPKGDGSYGDRTHWIPCYMFGKRAEGLALWLRKGDKVAVSGSLTESVWEKDGQKRRRIEVKVDEVELMSARRDRQGGQPSPSAAGPAEPAPAQDMYPDDVPF